MTGSSAVGNQASAQLVKALIQNPQQKQTELATKMAKVSMEQKLNPASNGQTGVGENLDVMA
ncbi:MAG: hypothetical protein EXS64_02295 [Candidatus Latescibacteria bacterium]|nr:hypothetical protein [Candidatus Latescibacterota bacterium]